MDPAPKSAASARNSQSAQVDQTNSLLPFELTPNRQLVSPTGEYLLIDRKPNNDKDGYIGQVFLFDKRSGRMITVVEEYTHSISASWSPDGAHFFLDDYYGSGIGTCRIYSVTDATHSVVDFIELLTKAEDPTLRSFPPMANYATEIAGLRWLSDTSIEVTVLGRGIDNPDDNYKAFMEYSLVKGVQNLRIYPNQDL
jgi:hypothetical protein